LSSSAVGAEYEYRLKSFLVNSGIPFLGEEQQRQNGQSKTPDVRLPIPIGLFFVLFIPSCSVMPGHLNSIIFCFIFVVPSSGEWEAYFVD